MKKFAIFAASVFPALVFAQVPVNSFTDLLGAITYFIGLLVPTILGLAILFFIFALLRYVTAKDEDTQKEARTLILNGVIILFVMVSVWGLVNILVGTFRLDTNLKQVPGIPGVPLGVPLVPANSAKK